MPGALSSGSVAALLIDYKITPIHTQHYGNHTMTTTLQSHLAAAPGQHIWDPVALRFTGRNRKDGDEDRRYTQNGEFSLLNGLCAGIALQDPQATAKAIMSPEFNGYILRGYSLITEGVTLNSEHWIADAARQLGSTDLEVVLKEAGRLKEIEGKAKRDTLKLLFDKEVKSRGLDKDPRYVEARRAYKAWQNPLKAILAKWPKVADVYGLRAHLSRLEPEVLRKVLADDQGYALYEQIKGLDYSDYPYGIPRDKQDANSEARNLLKPDCVRALDMLGSVARYINNKLFDYNRKKEEQEHHLNVMCEPYLRDKRPKEDNGLQYVTSWERSSRLLYAEWRTKNMCRGFNAWKDDERSHFYLEWLLGNLTTKELKKIDGERRSLARNFYKYSPTHALRYSAVEWVQSKGIHYPMTQTAVKLVTKQVQAFNLKDKPITRKD